MMRDLRIIVLAAGQGKRLRSDDSDLPKVLRQVAGRPLLAWVLDHLAWAGPGAVTLVVGYQAEKVRQAFGGNYKYALQKEQLGTGHAVASAAEDFAGYQGDVLVVYGDMPLYRPETYRNLVLRHQESDADCTLLTAVTSDIPAYGRIVRDQEGRFRSIVEQKDCTAEQLQIREVNPGVYVFRSPLLFQTLKQLRNDNAQGEYYLTDLPGLLLQASCKIETWTIEDDRQILGVNTPEDLAVCEEILKEARS
ncbi:MAG TPA: UDP-N-acetylglucosamine diphosphorylase [Clostridiales bacterium]|nr:UDP-N-acetylglucosamine diphosphorylase [Clostridiales bacterium]